MREETLGQLLLVRRVVDEVWCLAIEHSTGGQGEQGLTHPGLVGIHMVTRLGLADEMIRQHARQQCRQAIGDIGRIPKTEPTQQGAESKR